MRGRSATMGKAGLACALVAACATGGETDSVPGGVPGETSVSVTVCPQDRYLNKVEAAELCRNEERPLAAVTAAVRAGDFVPSMIVGTDAQKAAVIAAYLEGDLARVMPGARLEGCRNAVRLSVNGWGTNTSYGASCRVSPVGSPPYRATLCNDEYVGHFGQERTAGTATSDAVEAFIRARCWGG